VTRRLVDYSDHDEETEETDKEDGAADQVTVGPLTGGPDMLSACQRR
jgi:hypothetical protein